MKYEKVINPNTGAIEDEITGNGNWVLSAPFNSGAVSIYFRKGSGADPVGATIQAATSAWPDLPPVDVTGAVLTLPSLATAQASLPERVVPAGPITLKVSGYVAPIRVAGVGV